RESRALAASVAASRSGGLVCWELGSVTTPLLCEATEEPQHYRNLATLVEELRGAELHRTLARYLSPAKLVSTTTFGFGPGRPLRAFKTSKPLPPSSIRSRTVMSGCSASIAKS